ncbi:hypothetical protein ACDY96_05060 [Rhizobium mongolense]|uniref:hypothetical protein n=1 Tax=Rhizobium TaxID=379 RepID=UPI001EF99B66|nr:MULTISPECIES: hypothetical protein [Rhizobium]ULJ71181.1 hypothetical protein L2W42_14995 [Rhizobium gallicum]WFU87585.1 hypothetical protein QA644_00290 [Rhizobium sp. CC1099]
MENIVEYSLNSGGDLQELRAAVRRHFAHEIALWICSRFDLAIAGGFVIVRE